MSADHGGSCGAYWLLDEIALTQLVEPQVAAEGFQVWKLAVNPDSTATLTCEDGNQQPVFSKAIEYTDFQQTASRSGSPTTHCSCLPNTDHSDNKTSKERRP